MIQCVITSPEKTTHYDNIKSVTIPVSEGCTEILPHHAEAFFLVGAGTIVLYSSDGKSETVETKDGSCYVKDSKVMIIL